MVSPSRTLGVPMDGNVHTRDMGTPKSSLSQLQGQKAASATFELTRPHLGGT